MPSTPAPGTGCSHSGSDPTSTPGRGDARTLSPPPGARAKGLRRLGADAPQQKRGARGRRGGSARPEGRLRRLGEGLRAGPRRPRGEGRGRLQLRPPGTPAPTPPAPPAREQVAAGGGRGVPRLRVGLGSPARTRLLVLLVEFFNHLGRLPNAQTHRNRPRRRSRRAEEAAGRPAPRSHAGWAAAPSLGAKARPPRPPSSPGDAKTPSPASAAAGGFGQTLPGRDPGAHARSSRNVVLFGWRPLRTPQSQESEAGGLRVLCSPDDRGLFDNPLRGPPVAEGALPGRGSGGNLFQERCECQWFPNHLGNRPFTR